MRKQSSWVTLFNEDGKVLIMRRAGKANNPGQWNFPGGTIEGKYKNPAMTAYAELFEEAGIRSVILNFMFSFHTVDSDMFYYSGFIHNNPRVKLQKEENDKFLWVNMKDLHPHPRFTLHKSIINYFNKIDGSFIATSKVVGTKTLVSYSYKWSVSPEFQFYLSNPAKVIKVTPHITPLMIARFYEALKSAHINDFTFKNSISADLRTIVNKERPRN